MMQYCLRNKLFMNIILFTLVFFVTSCLSDLYYNYYDKNSITIREVNESNSDVFFLVPQNRNRIWWERGHLFMTDERFQHIDMNQLDISDTTMINYALTSVYVDYDGLVGSKSDKYILSYFLSLEEMMPYDTMRVFVYDGLFRQDPYGPLAGNLVPIENDLYFVRYDISIEDARKLINDKGELEIHFPPDERMKNIKMWPRYEDVISVNY